MNNQIQYCIVSNRPGLNPVEEYIAGVGVTNRVWEAEPFANLEDANARRFQEWNPYRWRVMVLPRSLWGRGEAE